MKKWHVRRETDEFGIPSVVLTADDFTLTVSDLRSSDDGVLAVDLGVSVLGEQHQRHIEFWRSDDGTHVSLIIRRPHGEEFTDEEIEPW